MGKYNGAVITTAGQNLIAQAIAESKTVTFTTAQASSHVYPSSTDFEALTALTDVEKTVDINYAGVYSDTVVQVSARFDNDGVETAYLINTLGFFAQLDSDTPILFAVSTAVTPDQMPIFDADNPSAFIYNMQITVQNANSISVSVNPAGTVTVDQLNTVVSTINANIGDLSDLTTDDKTSLVNAINEVDANADVAQASADSAQQMIAPVLSTLVAPAGGLAIGDQFVYNGLLYKATAAIAQGGTITIDGNCTLSSDLAKQSSHFIKEWPVPAITIAAKSYADINLDIGLTGWKYAGVMQWILNGANSICTIYISVTQGNNLRVRLYNPESSQGSINASGITVLYFKE